MRALDPREEHCAGPCVVVYVATFAADQARVFATVDFGSDHRRDGHGYSPPAATAWPAGLAFAPPLVFGADWTDLTMFTETRPPQRLPSRPLRVSSSVGFGFWSREYAAP